MCVLCAFAHAAGRDDPPAQPFPETAGPLPWPTGREAGGRLTWTGGAGLRFDLGGVSIAFDPFASRPGLGRVLFRRPRPDGAAARALFSGLRAVFFGHTHYDHALDLPAVAAASPEAVLYGSRTTVELGIRSGVPADRLVVLGDADRVELPPFTVEAVRSAHGKVPFLRFVDRLDLPARGLPRTPFRYPRGDVLTWRVEAAGRSFHVQGSAGIEGTPLARQRPADALIACLAARHGTPRYLERLGERLRPGVLVPCHHDDFFRPLAEPPRPIAGLDWAGFLEDARALEAAHGTEMYCPVRGAGVLW